MPGYELPEDCAEITRDEDALEVFGHIRERQEEYPMYDGVPGTDVIRDVDVEPSDTYTALRKLVSSGVVDVTFAEEGELSGSDAAVADLFDERASMYGEDVEPVYSVADHIAVGDVVNAFVE
ncbi:MAG: hypothetical protein SVU32_01685 [Candidatus Nanohaloarchaea archaeon]|nr:hypothetical protein [Candidatus Nanohaloarchaea archaeon]